MWSVVKIQLRITGIMKVIPELQMDGYYQLHGLFDDVPVSIYSVCSA
jgi:hypothetical protein